MADEFFGKLPFHLNGGERILGTVKPIWRGYWQRIVVKGLLISLIYAVPLGLTSPQFTTVPGVYVFLGVLVAAAIVSFVIAKIGYGKFQVWLTNQRIVSSGGFIGFHTESMPLENIVDVVMNRGVIDRILHISSIMAVPMGGTAFFGKRSSFSTVGFIPALHPDDAVKLQKRIFDLRNAKKKADRQGII